MAAQGPSGPRAHAAAKQRLRLHSSPGRHAVQGQRSERPIVALVVATRPDAVKLASVHAELSKQGAFRPIVVHTGQHTDPALTTDIFRDVRLPPPEHVLHTGAGTHGAQTAHALAAGEALLADLRPAVIIVAGAANSTLGVVLAASKLAIPVARIEAGLRTRNGAAGDNLNRALLDTMADILFVPTAQAAENLAAEGAGTERVYLVGSTAVDALRHGRRDAARRKAWQRFAADPGRYVLVTLHDPANVDDDERLARIVEALAAMARRVSVIFPLHPRTRERLHPMGDAHRLAAAGVSCAPPLGYLDFLSLASAAGAVVTDSGTVQEETSALGVTCYTMLSATERTITLSHGTNVLLDDPRDLAELLPTTRPPTPSVIPFWDGRAGQRVGEALVARYALPARRRRLRSGSARYG